VVNFSLSVELNEFWLLPAESPWPATFVNYFLAIDSFVLTSAQTCWVRQESSRAEAPNRPSLSYKWTIK